MWTNININKNLIKMETERAILINCPHSSNYDGYSFWHPKKLIREGRNSASFSIGLNETFTFHLIKKGNGKHNFNEIISEEDISVLEFEEMFTIIDENIVAPKIDDEAYLEVEEPVKINVNVEIQECLKNNN